jgi:fibronectin type 3 domain-containing protein
MLRKTVFVTCVKNLAGRGTPSGAGTAQITLTWTAQTNANGYAVLRSATNGGPYTKVGTTQTTVYNDRSGLTNGSTYYYVVQPLQGGTEICQSNQATVTIPK